LHPINALHSLRSVGKSDGACRDQRSGSGRIAIPDVNGMTFVEQAANEARAHQPGAQECNLHEVSP
jgi:hypothetical protein